MSLCKKILAISFKEKTVFRFDYMISTVFAFLYIFLKVYIWKGLYSANENTVDKIVINDMIIYSILASFTEGVTKTSVMKELNNGVLDGTIALNLLLPMGFKKYMFINSFSQNVFQTIYGVVPSVIIAALFFKVDIDTSFINMAIYGLSLVMGILISFLYNFLFGLSVIWFRNSFFLNNMNSVLLRLFSGAFVPIWFFPESLKRVSVFLPFRYIVFEPISIFLNTKSSSEIVQVLGMQLFWILVLYYAAKIMWDRGRSRVMIQGG